jgi:hypothetical protein
MHETSTDLFQNLRPQWRQPIVADPSIQASRSNPKPQIRKSLADPGPSDDDGVMAPGSSADVSVDL